MANEIDALMDLDPLDMSTKDIDAIIAYHRNNRARENAAGKMEKPKAPKGQGPKLNLADLLQGMAKKDEAEAPKPTSGRGLRRV